MSQAPEFLDKIIWKRFWDQQINEVDWTEQFVAEFFESDLHLHCSREFLAVAHSYQDDFNTKSASGIPSISSSGQKFEPGVLNGHVVQYSIKKQPMLLELPAIEVTVDAKPYVTMLEGIKQNSSSIGKADADFVRAFGRALAYCYRLGISTGPLSVVAMQQMGWKWERIDKIKQAAKPYAALVQTVDFWLAEWVERAAAVCNTQQQIDILVWVYCQAAQYNTKQPRICKSTVALELDVSRKSVNNLFKKLETHGLMVQQPEELVERNGRLTSNARIVNLDTDELNRWTNYERNLPGPDRSQETRARNKWIEERLAFYASKPR